MKFDVTLPTIFYVGAFLSAEVSKARASKKKWAVPSDSAIKQSLRSKLCEDRSNAAAEAEAIAGPKS